MGSFSSSNSFTTAGCSARGASNPKAGDAEVRGGGVMCFATCSKDGLGGVCNRLLKGWVSWDRVVIGAAANFSSNFTCRSCNACIIWEAKVGMAIIRLSRDAAREAAVALFGFGAGLALLVGNPFPGFFFLRGVSPSPTSGADERFSSAE